MNFSTIKYTYLLLFLIIFQYSNFFSFHLISRVFQSKNIMKMSTNFKESTSNENENKIEVYSRIGCKYCRIAKAKLSEIGLSYVNYDINNFETELINEYSRKENIEQRINHAKSSTVPQIYIGNNLIGGCDKLLEEITSNKLFERLNAYNIIPIKVESSISANSDKLISNIDYLSLVHQFGCLNQIETIENTENKNISLNSFSALELSKNLLLAVLKLTDDYVYLNGSTNYHSLIQSNDFYNFVKLTELLIPINSNEIIKIMNEQMKLAFFVNIYNTMIIHSIIIFGQTENNPNARMNFFSGKIGTIYSICGLKFSPDDIEHGIIRANQPKSLTDMNGLFKENDLRLKFKLNKLNYKIHFILNCGAKSCPAIILLDANNIENVLSLAAASYLDSQISFDSNISVLFLPKLAFWYSHDFGNNLLTQIITLIDMLSIQKKEQILNDLVHNNIELQNGLKNDSIFITKNEILEYYNLQTHINDENILVQYNNYDWT